MFEISGKNRNFVVEVLTEQINAWVHRAKQGKHVVDEFADLLRLITAYQTMQGLGTTSDVGTSGTSPDVPPAKT